MGLKSILLLLLTFIVLNAKAQILLNADSSQIKKTISVRGGGLKKSFIEKNIEMKGLYKKMVFRFPTPMEGNSCLMDMTFCLTLKNECFKYYEDYWGEDIANQRIDDLKKSYELKQVKGYLKWVDDKKGFEISMIPERIGNNKFASAYILEIKNN